MPNEQNKARLLSIQNQLHAQISLCEQLAATDASEIRAMVGRWSFAGNAVLDQREVDPRVYSQAVVSLLKTYAHAYDIFFDHLPHYPTLHHLTLGEIQVNDHIVDLLTTLPSLKDLHLLRCHFICEGDHHLKLRSLDIEGEDRFPMELDDHLPHPAAPLQFFCRSTLERLTVRTERGVRMILSHSDRLYVSEMGYLTHLTLELSASLAVQNDFLRFLRQSSNLQSLAVQSKWIDMQCGASPLAHLQTYDGPTNLAGIVLQGTLVKTVRLRNFESGHFEDPLDHPNISSALVSLGLMALSLRCLRIMPIHNPTHHVFDLIAELFPNISSLELMFEDSNYRCTPLRTAQEQMLSANNGFNSDHMPVEVRAPLMNASPLSVLLDEMSAGRCMLPHAVQQLELRYRYNFYTTTVIHLPIETQQRVVWGLSKSNPTLRRVDMYEIWMLIGDVWIQG
ncbi:hypothetical protein FIBSPDRAFT_1053748 [Athelia psychrophila]|uniref:F-box domain-containing protein n=1 Tax=Athelia psychrophila TaxID=1759441 RepID=A0A167WGM3_9AGAM|nr:hypothetical protein FIBSPDRAFT_1053748 [Fibularhizoctonia sp. CBS 109695]